MGPRLFSRGKGPVAALDRGLEIASMGPRLFSRGKALQGLRTTRSRELQWGRGCSAAERLTRSVTRQTLMGFNGAAAVQPRKEPESGLSPTCGAAASMGPRLFSRGKNIEATHRRGKRKASMGPRLFSRGKAGYSTRWMDSGLLQWGRGCSAAESDPSARSPAAPSKLQWGRGCSAAESTAAVARRVGMSTASMGPRLFSRGK